jgi:hypothetical protein
MTHQTLLQSLLSPAVQKFIKRHELDDEKSVVLRYKPIAGVPASLIAAQISGRKKSKTKLPVYYASEEIIYPPSINLEQSSSQSTALFKTKLIPAGDRFADLTGGFGIDTYFLSKNFRRATYVEPDEFLLEIVKHNHQVLGQYNVEYYSSSAEDFLSHTSQHFDLIFIDPSRRSENKKVFKLSDCVPDITSIQHQLFDHTETVLIKTSPILDLQQGLKALQFVQKVFVVSVENECKEVLFLCQKDFNGEPSVEAINLLLLKNHTDKFVFSFSEEQHQGVEFSDPLNYLYEPNASILKAGAFKRVASQYKLLKIQSNTHLYTSQNLVSDFPGKIFKVEAQVKPDQKILKHYFPEGKANVTTRNYPLSPEQLKKKTKLNDGGDKFLIGFSGKTQKFLVVAIRVKN